MKGIMEEESDKQDQPDRGGPWGWHWSSFIGIAKKGESPTSGRKQSGRTWSNVVLDFGCNTACSLLRAFVSATFKRLLAFDTHGRNAALKQGIICPAVLQVSTKQARLSASYIYRDDCRCWVSATDAAWPTARRESYIPQKEYGHAIFTHRTAISRCCRLGRVLRVWMSKATVYGDAPGLKHWRKRRITTPHR